MRMTIAFRLRFMGNRRPKDCSHGPVAMSSACRMRASEGKIEGNTRLRSIEAFL
jgi:hypothetical protein